MPNNQHAARLREMAERRSMESAAYQQRWVALGYHTKNAEFVATVGRDESEIAALLAGAEALDAVEAYRRYDAFGRDNSAWVGPEAKNSAETSKGLWAEFRAALARLEGE